MSYVEIRVEGHLDKAWLEWFEGFSMEHLSGNQTLLCGSVTDQAALYGLIAKLRDLGAKLVSVNFDGETSTNLSQ
jgi:hypothetical protein